MPALTMKETPRPSSVPTEKNLEDQIRRRAYEFYQARGHEDGHALDDWLQAEIDVTGNATSGSTP
jgi:hypothetical protein